MAKRNICLSVCLSVYLSVCLSVCLSIYLSIYLSVGPPTRPSTYPSIHPSTHPSTHHLSIYPPTHPSTYPSIHQPIHPPTHPPTHLPTHLSIYLPTYLPSHEHVEDPTALEKLPWQNFKASIEVPPLQGLSQLPTYRSLRKAVFPKGVIRISQAGEKNNKYNSHWDKELYQTETQNKTKHKADRICRKGNQQSLHLDDRTLPANKINVCHFLHTLPQHIPVGSFRADRHLHCGCRAGRPQKQWVSFTHRIHPNIATSNCDV